MTTTPPDGSDLDATRRDMDDRVVSRFLWVAVFGPALIGLVALVAQLLVMGQVPDPAAIHWGAGGQPDGYANPVWYLLLTVILAAGVPVAMGLFAFRGLRRGDRGPMYRFIGAFAFGFAVYSALVMTASLAIQAGLSSAQDAGSVLPWLLGALAVGLGAGAVAWFIQPAQRDFSSTRRSVTAGSAPPGLDAVWRRTIMLPKPVMVVLGLAVVLVASAAITTWLTGERLVAVILTVLTAVIAVLAVVTAIMHVRVDAAGLAVTAALGWPRFGVSIDDVESVAVSRINPIGDFGGWGLRGRPGKFGIIMRTGDAIVVTRRNGHEFVVTVDDADSGAALLAGFAASATRG